MTFSLFYEYKYLRMNRRGTKNEINSRQNRLDKYLQ